jgi:hypothetical protein
MEERKNLVRMMARIWRIHHRKEAIYKSLVGMDVSMKMRKCCCNGHMSSVLFKKDIQAIYESLKCNFSDGDLGNIVRSDDGQEPDDEYQVKVELLLEEQKRLLELYTKAITWVSYHPEMQRLLTAHLDKIKELNMQLECVTEMEHRGRIKAEPSIEYDHVA